MTAIVPRPFNLEISEGATTFVHMLDGKLALGGSLRRPRIWTLALLVAVGAIVAWCVMAPIDRVVRSEGRIVPSSKNRSVQHLEGGVVAKIHVSEGQRVRAGEVLVEIGSTEADAELKERAVKLEGLRAKIERLQAEVKGGAMGAGGELTSPRGLERLTLAGRQAKLRQNAAVLQEQRSQRQAEISELQGRGRHLRDELVTARKQLETHEMLVRQNAGSELDVLEARSRVQRLSTELGGVELRIPQLQGAIREISERISSEAVAFRSDSGLELATASTEARAIEEELRNREQRLKRTVISSPVDGVVNRVFVTSEGSVLRPGEPAVEVTPLGGEITVEAKIQPTDRAELRPGLAAVIKLGAYDYTRYGSLEAVLDDISADALTDEKGNSFYRLRLRVKDASVKGFAQPVLPGMTASADVVLGRRTVGSYISSAVLRFGSTAFRDSR